jgi:asparagine synthase (glutamine-hydrolysing)
MCGIFGARGQIAAAHEALRHAAARQTRRGPDGFGEWASPDHDVYLAHNRLAIIDLTDASSQPFHTRAGVLVYNGEIYNYVELKKELVAEGAAFVTDGDTEVLATVIERWGFAGLSRVRGMFAFAYYEHATKTLTLARDRFGIKPLFVASRGGGVLFASEIEALRDAFGFGEHDEEARAIYHLLNYLPAPFTFYRDIVKVPPGHLVHVKDSGYTLEEWYRLEPRVHGDLTALLQRSVAEHMRCDVEYGVFLSGGLDSNIVASLASDVAPGKIRTFSIGFTRFPAFDETAAIGIAAAHLGSQHHQFDIDARDFEAAARECLGKLARGEPFADASFVPTWLVSGRTRAESKVALSGDGADEVFGGYRKYRGIRAASLMRMVPENARKHMLALAARLPEARDSRALELARRFKKFLQGAGKEQHLRQLAWLYTFFPDEVDSFLPGRGSGAEQRLGRKLEELARKNGKDDEINAALRADTMIFLAADMLHKVDLASMDHSLEVRVPFLDHEVVETAFALPGDRKVSLRAGKLELRRRFGDRLPRALLSLPKRGFESPLSSLFRSSFAGELGRSAKPLIEAGIPRDYIETLEREHASSRSDHSIRMWNLLVLSHWLSGGTAARRAA